MSEPADRQPLHIAAAQFAAASGEVAANLAEHCRLIAEAAAEGASVVLFPELSIPGYAADLLAVDPQRLVLDPHGPALDPLRTACRDNGVVALAGAVLPGPLSPSLSLLAIDREGDLCARYDKQHLDGPERDWFTPGAAACAIEVDGWRLGLGICYDASFPEHARAQALDGADAYLVSGAFPRGASDRRRAIYFPARALENTIYVAFANFVGGHGGHDYCGHSALYGPDGSPLADAAPERPGLAAATLDPAALTDARERLRMLDERRQAGPVLGRA